VSYIYLPEPGLWQVYVSRYWCDWSPSVSYIYLSEPGLWQVYIKGYLCGWSSLPCHICTCPSLGSGRYIYQDTEVAGVPIRLIYIPARARGYVMDGNSSHFSTLRTRTEMILEKIFSPFNHLTRLEARENFIGQGVTE
jgi:hypothetical protein